MMSGSLSWAYKRVYDGVNYRLRSFAGGRFADRCRPVSIVLLMTEICNAKCVHCDIWKNTYRETGPTPQRWKEVLSELRSWLGPVHVGVSGGEALIKPYTPEVVAHAAKIGLFLEILTHGYWEDQNKIERLAMANPWQITVSLDGIGETHTVVRGHPMFWERTSRTIDTLLRMRREKKLSYRIRLKTVIMAHNIHDVANVARYAAEKGANEVFYQPIEQNYNTPEDTRWFEYSANWPKDTGKAVAAVEELIALKRTGLPIANSFQQLEAMIPYFKNPDAMRVAVQSHAGHEGKASCTAMVGLQLQPNGDVIVCYGKPPVGNVVNRSIRDIWESRPKFWEQGTCCLNTRRTEAEKETFELVNIS